MADSHFNHYEYRLLEIADELEMVASNKPRPDYNNDRQPEPEDLCLEMRKTAEELRRIFVKVDIFSRFLSGDRSADDVRKKLESLK